MSEEDTRLCENCKLQIATRNYVTHTLHCVRHLERCKKCGEPIPKDKMNEHIDLEHAVENCPDCMESMDSNLIETHLRSECSKRPITCPYCELELPSCDMAQHTEYCGTRTERCSDCKELVMLKYNQLHLESNHNFIKLEDEPGPSASWQEERKTASIVKPELPDNGDQTLLPCQFCDGMFAPRELRRHQISCRLGWQTSVPVLRGMPVTTCNSCNKSIAARDYESHKELCGWLAPDSSSIRTQSQPATDEDKIPCDVCHKSIAFEEYRIHHSLCSRRPVVQRPTRHLSRLEQTEDSIMLCSAPNRTSEIEELMRRHPTYDQPAIQSRDTTDRPKRRLAYSTKLPCEFCDILIRAENLEAHQMSCLPKHQQATIPCELCGEPKLIAEVYQHQLTCRVSGDN